MQFKTLFVTLLAVGFSSAATTPCVRDACYNQVGTNAAGRPNASSRSADCRAALKTVIDSDITVTATITTTVYPFTVTTTGCPAQATLTVREEIHERCAGAMPRGLGKRDTIIVAGPKPAYVSSCGNLQDVSSAASIAESRADTGFSMLLPACVMVSPLKPLELLSQLLQPRLSASTLHLLLEFHFPLPRFRGSLYCGNPDKLLENHSFRGGEFL